MKKYSLKKIYEFRSTFNDRNIDIKNIKSLSDLYTPIERKTKLVNIEGLGRFELNNLQICLIACANEFFFGDESIVRRILNIDKIKKKQEQLDTDSLDADSLDTDSLDTDSLDITKESLIHIKENKLDYNKLDYNRALDFIENCYKEEIVDQYFNIMNNKKIPSSDFIGKASGYLFEFFLNKYFKNKNYKTNLEEHSKSILTNKNIKYISCILKIIYLYEYTGKEFYHKSNDYDELEHYVYDMFYDLESTDVNYLYEVLKIKDNLDNGKIIEKLISTNDKDTELTFNFNTSLESLDVSVTNVNQELVTIFDIKTSLAGIHQHTLSDSFKNCEEQINNYKNKTINFTVGLVNILYDYTPNGIKINSIKDEFITQRQFVIYKENVVSKENPKFRFNEEVKIEIGGINSSENHSQKYMIDTNYTPDKYDANTIKVYRENYLLEKVEKCANSIYHIINTKDKPTPAYEFFKKSHKRKNKEFNIIQNNRDLLERLLDKIKSMKDENLNKNKQKNYDLVLLNIEEAITFFFTEDEKLKLKEIEIEKLISKLLELLCDTKKNNNKLIKRKVDKNNKEPDKGYKNIYNSKENLLKVKNKFKKYLVNNDEAYKENKTTYDRRIALLDKVIEFVDLDEEEKLKKEIEKEIEIDYKKIREYFIDNKNKNILNRLDFSRNYKHRDAIIEKLKNDIEFKKALKKADIRGAHSKFIKDKLNVKKSLDKNSFDRGRDKLLREVYYDLFREGQ